MYKDTKRKISVDYIKSEFDNEESFDLEKYIKNKYDIIPNNEQIIGDCDIDREQIQKWLVKMIEISDKKTKCVFGVERESDNIVSCEVFFKYDDLLFHVICSFLWIGAVL